MERLVLLWMALLMSLVVFKPLVYCAQCSVDTDCTQTTGTTASCNSGTCSCSGSEYIPIRTGCGVRLESPVLVTESGRSNDIFVGSNAPLTCQSRSGNPASYAWYKGGAKLPDSTPTINITQAGTYECKSVSRVPALNSGNSTSLTIAAVTGTSYSVKTVTAREPPSATTLIFTGGSVTIACKNVPLGYNGKLTIQKDSDILAEPVSLSATIQVTAALSGASVKCVLQPFQSVSFQDSDPITLPTVDNSIAVSEVELQVDDSLGGITTAVTYNIGNDGPTFLCKVTPSLELLDSANPPIIQFVDDIIPSTTVQSGTSNIFILNTTQQSDASYKCIVTYKGNTKETALSQRITVASGALPDPTILKVSTGDIAIGSTLVLACGNDGITSANYIWTFNDLPIEGQKDKKIQMYNFTSDDVGVYKCRYRNNRYTSGDGTFNALPKPTVTREPEGTFFGQYGDYVLRCNSGSSTTTGWTYSWKKGNSDLAVTSDVYSFTDADATDDDGAYTCTTSYKGASVSSDAFTVAVVEPGKRCTADAECTGLKYTGKCSTTTPAVCVCASHYRLKGEDCASGAAAMISCVLMVVMASLRALVF